MFWFSMRYAGAELRRRWTRALLTAAGLAAAVGLIVAITALSNGFDRAGQQVLAPLASLGADIVVTQSVDKTNEAGTAAADPSALIEANRSVVTNLAALGKPGQHFTHDFFVLASLLPVPRSTTSQLAALPRVRDAIGGLTVLASHQTGIVPTIVASLTTGGQTLTELHKPAPLSVAEAAAVRACVLSSGALTNLAAAATSSTSSALPEQIQSCLPTRFREYVAQVNVPVQTVKQVLDPPQTNIRSRPYTAAGVDPAHPADGFVTRAQLRAGRYVMAGDEIMVDTSYARASRLRLGSSLAINGGTFHVVGLVSSGLGGQSADVYFPLATLQGLTSQEGKVNVVLVHADRAEDVAAVKSEIHRLLPTAQLTTSSELINKVRSSLADTRKLGDRLGRALALVVLVGGFGITVLLTLSSVAKRVREIGTLRAVGWSRRRVSGQLMLEALGIGAVGAVLGVALGVVMSAVVTRFVPPLASSSFGSTGNGTSIVTLAGVTNHLKGASSVSVHIVAAVAPASVAAGVALALVGSVLAGLVGGWRASSLTPSVALRDLG